MDVVGRSPEAVFAFRRARAASHALPTDTDQRRAAAADGIHRGGRAVSARLDEDLSPTRRRASLPKAGLLETFPAGVPSRGGCHVLPTVSSLGNKRFAEVIRFGDKEQQMTEEAARRLAAGVDPGIVPARLLDRRGPHRDGEPQTREAQGSSRRNFIWNSRGDDGWRLKRRCKVSPRPSDAVRDSLASLGLTVVEDRPRGMKYCWSSGWATWWMTFPAGRKKGATRPARGQKAIAPSAGLHRAGEALALANERFIQLEYRFFR